MYPYTERTKMPFRRARNANAAGDSAVFKAGRVQFRPQTEQRLI
jgi:hypothetical protein